jgi:hypothetical protein
MYAAPTGNRGCEGPRMLAGGYVTRPYTLPAATARAAGGAGPLKLRGSDIPSQMRVREPRTRRTSGLGTVPRRLQK